MRFEHFFSYLALAVGFLFCLYANAYWSAEVDLKVSFLDVGQGDSIFIETPHGRTVLIDGGPGTSVIERLGEVTSFWMKHFDLVVLTHPDLDHLEGLLEVLPRYQIDHLLMTGIAHDSQLYRSFLEMLQQQQIETSIASPDQDWQLDEDIFLDILEPPGTMAFQEVKKANDTSIIARLIYRNASMLLTGDAETPEEERVLHTDSDLRVDFLKSPHHGSRTSSSLDFLRSAQATQAAITSGRENPFGHPHLETILKYDDLGMRWWNTKEEGTMTFVSDGAKWERQ